MQTRTVKFKLPEETEKAVKWLFKNKNPKGLPKELIQKEIDNSYNHAKQNGINLNHIIVGSYRTK